MSQYAVIVENDESQWADVKGQVYHFPSRYLRILEPGCKVIYYKGKIKSRTYASSRLSDAPHYFGIAEIGESVRDKASSKKDYFCEIKNYQEFESAVLAKLADDEYLEPIPESRKTNYWRDGVREISKETYERILSQASTLERTPISVSESLGEYESYGVLEGQKKQRYTTYYERNPMYRQKALDIHGYDCMVCGFNFEKVYGSLGKGFIHVHHNKPVSEGGPMIIDPENDLSILCPNCHAMVHRQKGETLAVQDLKSLLEKDR